MRKPEAASCQHALCRVAFAQHHFDRTGSRNVRHNARSQRARKLVETLEVSRIGHRDVQSFLIALEGHELVPHHQIDGHFRKQVVIDWRLAIGRQQIDKREPVTAREFPCRLHLGRHMLFAVMSVFPGRRHRPDHRILVS